MVVVVCLGIGVRGQIKASAELRTDAEAYSVYSAVFRALSDAHKDSKRLIIIAESSVFPSSTVPGSDKVRVCMTPAPGDEAERNPVIEAYQTANKGVGLLEARLDIALPYEIVPRSLVSSIIRGRDLDDGWKTFYAKYPDSGGYFEVSRIGFNADRTLALVYAGNYCGSLCGRGSYYFYGKVNGKWVPLPWRGNGCSWVS